jgi:hypothetical protein
MNILKNMEAIFLAATILAGATELAAAQLPASHQTPAASVAQVVAAAPVADNVVVIKGKRLSAAEKARSL